jgi:CMP-N-acetylneuraminic acid synthetase
LEKRRYIGLIPARAGSKGVKNKNFRSFGATSLIGLTVKAAEESAVLDEIWVTTDDESKTRSCISDAGVHIHLRPKLLASDDATANEVIRDFIMASSARVGSDDFLVYLQPTSPLRNHAWIRKAIEEHSKGEFSVIGVVQAGFRHAKLCWIDSNGQGFSSLPSSLMGANRQSLPEAYRPNGSIYVFSVAEFLAEGSIPLARFSPLVMDEVSSIDIDTMDDFKSALSYHLSRSDDARDASG